MKLENIVVLGSGGMLGSEICEALNIPEKNRLHKIDINFEKPMAVAAVINNLKPSMVINAAGFTDVDASESDAMRANLYNAVVVGEIAKGCRQAKASLIHFSTDYIFDGKSNDYLGYNEDEKPSPLNKYGKSKFNGEQYILESGLMSYYIIRTSWLFSKRKGFVKTILERAVFKNSLDGVSDEVGCPTYAKDLANSLSVIVDNNAPGIYHLTNKEHCSRAEFATEILKQAGIFCKINPITQKKYREKYGIKTIRPSFSVLNNTKIKDAKGNLYKLRPWQDAVKDCIGEYVKMITEAKKNEFA